MNTLTRRWFLKGASLAMAGAGTAPAWLGRAAFAANAPRKKVLVAVFQRGAMDGLNVVAPYGEQAYYDLRPNLALPRPDGTRDALIDLDGYFGLHPALAALKPIFEEQRLAVIHATGSPDPTRSHFDAQDYMESGTPGRKATTDGWLNRALVVEKKASPIRAVSMGPTLARALRGRNDAVAVNSLNDFQVKDARGADSFEAMYGATKDVSLNATGRETFEAVKLVQSFQKQPYTPENGATYPAGKLGQSLKEIARLIKAQVGLEVAFADIGGWDTHVNEIGTKPVLGQLANRLDEFGNALAAFYTDMGDAMADVTVVTMSEFGRTAKENGTRGTDHGHANVMFAFGGSVKGGKVYGDWPGLKPDKLYEQRDLDVTTDFRDVLGELVVRHLGNQQIGTVFPGFETPKFRGLLG
jgi:uncharacterized protein (DUF1501 family)